MVIQFMKLLSVAFIKQFSCQKQQLKTGTRLRRQTRMTTNLKIPFFFKFHPHFCRPLLIAARSGPPLPPLPRYATAERIAVITGRQA